MRERMGTKGIVDCILDRRCHSIRQLLSIRMAHHRANPPRTDEEPVSDRCCDDRITRGDNRTLLFSLSRLFPIIARENEQRIENERIACDRISLAAFARENQRAHIMSSVLFPLSSMSQNDISSENRATF